MSPTFRSLRVRNYRRYAIGQLLANTGIWMQRVAQDWLVLELTDGSPLALGITVGLQFLPMLLLGLWGGGLADRFRRRQLLLITSTLMGVMALAMGTIVLIGLASVWLVMVLAFVLGAIAAVDNPARQAFVSEMVDRDDLPNAVALSTASFNLGRVLGPAAAGLLIAAIGTGWVFVINALGYLAVVVALKGIRSHDLRSPAPLARDGGELRAGLRYVWSRPSLVLVLAIAFFVGTFGLNFQLTIASMTTVEFGLGPAAFGLASTVLAVGSLGGSLAAASRGAPRIRLVVLAAVGFGAAAITVSVMPTYVTFLAALPLVGMAALTLINAAQSYLQLNSAPEMRGRVMGIYTLLFLGGTPIGSPLVGWVAATYGPRWSIALGGVVSALAALTAAGFGLRAGRLGVRAHFTPRPHLHIGTDEELENVRDGASLRPRQDALHVVAGPLVAILALVVTNQAGSAFVQVSGAFSAAVELPAVELVRPVDTRINEASGMAQSQVHRELTWIINDSGGGPYVYGVDATGETAARLTLSGAENRDWEAMASGIDAAGKPALWIADIGDNDRHYSSVNVYRITEPTELGDQNVAWDRFEFTYPDQAHDAEALLVRPKDDRLFFVTKGAFDAAIYATSSAPQPGVAETLAKVADAPTFVTDGAVSPDGKQVALRTYTTLLLFDAATLLDHGDDDSSAFDLPNQPQGETLAYVPRGSKVIVGSEGEQVPLFLVDLPSDISTGTSGDDGTVTSFAQDRTALLAAMGVAGLAALVALGVGIVRRGQGRRIKR